MALIELGINYIVKHYFDGQTVTKGTFKTQNPVLTIDHPKQGQYYIKDWQLSEKQATEDQPLFGLKSYQGTKGYNLCSKWSKPKGFLDETPASISEKIKTRRRRKIKFPKISERKKPEPIDFNIKVEGKIKLDKPSTVSTLELKYILLKVINNDGEALIFHKKGTKTTVRTDTLTITPSQGSGSWNITLPPFDTPYFGVATIVATAVLNVEYNDLSTKTTTQRRMEVPFERKIVLLGLQLGVTDGASGTEKTDNDEKIVSDFKDPSYLKYTSQNVKTKAKNSTTHFRTRRMQVFETQNSARLMCSQLSGEKPVLENRTGPMMPEPHCEVQLLGLAPVALDLITDYLADKGINQSEIQEYLNLKCDWHATLGFKGGAIRKPPESNTFVTYEFSQTINGCTKANLKVYRSGLEKAGDIMEALRLAKDRKPVATRNPYLSDFHHKPLSPPELEYATAKPVFENRHWQQKFHMENLYKFSAAIIPWQPVIGYWVNNEGRVITDETTIKYKDDGIYEVDGRDPIYYVQRVRCGDLDVDASVTVFNKTYEMQLPTVRIEGSNPTKSQILEVLNEQTLDRLVDTVDNGVTRLRPISDREKLKKFLSIFGKQSWLDVCYAVIWHESGSISNSDILHFNKRRTQYNINGGAKAYQLVTQEIQHMPNFGGPGGWTLGMFDKPAVIDLTKNNVNEDADRLWHWDQAVVEMMKRLTIDKLLGRAFISNFPGVPSKGKKQTQSEYHQDLLDYDNYVGKRSITTIKRSYVKNGTTTVWYSNTVRNGPFAVKELYNTNKAIQVDAANVLAWLAMRYYNGGGMRANKYPKKVGADSNIGTRAPYYIGI